MADYESKIRNIRILKLILPVAIIVLYVEGILVSKIDSECIINITFTTVIAAIVLVAFMISLPQIEANKNARNISTVIYLCQSYMIGDGENDIKAGLAAGCKAILVNGAGTDAKNEDFGQADTLSSVLEFVDKYLQ